MWERAVALAQQAGDRERAAIYMSAEAVCEAHFGNAAEAKRRAAAALNLAKGRVSKACRRPGETIPGGYAGAIRVSLPTLRALFALTHGAPLDAVEHLERAHPYDLALPGTAFFAKFGGLYPAYIRGESYLAAGRAVEGSAVRHELWWCKGFRKTRGLPLVNDTSIHMFFIRGSCAPKPPVSSLACTPS